MPDFIPYLILTIISIIILSVVIVRKQQFGVLVLFLCFSGMVYIAEIFVMVIGNAYVYSPEVLSIQYYDNVLGAIVSNFFVIPALGVAVSVYQLRLRWLVFVPVTLVGVEWLFLWLNIYHTNWWRMEYTFIVVLAFLLLTKFWLRALQLGAKWVGLISLWMQGWSLTATVMYITSVAGIHRYHLGFFGDVYHDDIFISAVISLIKGLVFCIVILFFQRFRWRLLAPIVVYGIDLLLYYLGVRVVEIPFLLYTMIYLVVATLLLWWTQYAYNFICKISSNGKGIISE